MGQGNETFPRLIHLPESDRGQTGRDGGQTGRDGVQTGERGGGGSIILPMPPTRNEMEAMNGLIFHKRGQDEE